MKRVLILYKEKIALKTVEKNSLFLQTKRRGNSTYWFEVLVYPHTTSKAHARVVSIMLILSCV